MMTTHQTPSVPSKILAMGTAAILAASSTWWLVATSATATATMPSLVISAAAPPAGLSVEAKDDPFKKGFDFKFKSDTSTTELSIDPLGNKHSASASLGSKAGTISLTGKYSPNDRQITIVAKRGGQEIGEFTWRVEAVLR